VRISKTCSAWRPALASVLLAGLVLALASCNSENPIQPPGGGITPNDTLQVADFALPDVNPNSATHDQAISPRDYLNKVSAWYFGHAT
jgi:predicted component of type VI protein secretion system